MKTFQPKYLTHVVIPLVTWSLSLSVYSQNDNNYLSESKVNSAAEMHSAAEANRSQTAESSAAIGTLIAAADKDKYHAPKRVPEDSSASSKQNSSSYGSSASDSSNSTDRAFDGQERPSQLSDPLVNTNKYDAPHKDQSQGEESSGSVKRESSMAARSQNADSTAERRSEGATTDSNTDSNLQSSNAKKAEEDKYAQSQSKQSQSKKDTTTKDERASEPFTQEIVLFDFDSDELNSEAQGKLDKLADKLKRNEEVHLVISGYADATGPEEYNLDLAKRRSEAVKRSLEELGIADIVVTTKAYGESDPIADNGKKAGREENRRVEIEIIEQQPS